MQGFSRNGFCWGHHVLKVFFSDADLAESIQFLNSFKTMYGQKYPMRCNSMTLVAIDAQKQREIKDTEIVNKDVKLSCCSKT